MLQLMSIQIEFALATTFLGYILGGHMNECPLLNNVMWGPKSQVWHVINFRRRGLELVFEMWVKQKARRNSQQKSQQLFCINQSRVDSNGYKIYFNGFLEAQNAHPWAWVGKSMGMGTQCRALQSILNILIQHSIPISSAYLP